MVNSSFASAADDKFDCCGVQFILLVGNITILLPLKLIVLL